MILKRFIGIALALIAALLALFLIFRGVLLENALDKVKAKISDQYHVNFNFKEAHFEGIARVAITQLSITPLSGDTLLYCNKTAATISLWRYFKGLPPINNFLLQDGFIHLVEHTDSSNNYSFLFSKKDTTQTTDEEQQPTKNYSRVAKAIWKKFFDAADFNFEITNFSIDRNNYASSESVLIKEGSLQKTILSMQVANSTEGKNELWKVMGIIDPRSEIMDLNISNSSNTATSIPFIENFTGIKFFLNNFVMSVSMNSVDKNTLVFKMHAAATQIGLNHWRISPEDVVIDSIGMKLNLYVNDTSCYLDKESILLLNQIPINTNISYSKNENTLISADIKIAPINANTYFQSLPKGLFTTLEGIEAEGKLNYHLQLSVNLDAPDSLLFNSELQKTDFKILKFGNENFAAINHPFTYTAREKDKVVRVFEVGPGNPMYTPFENISPLLINSVLTSEDGTFYFHNGFNEEAFRESIVTNIKEKRFARGGSTISMQLVKNVFLNRNKTISRKVEEALIVWLIENNRIVSKQRMLEVYLNIIEWGPGIYGIGEASQFYFSKFPAQLTLDESIFLASIIPRPKYFMYSFQKDGSLKEYLRSYFQLVAGRLVKKEIIPQESLDQLRFQVELKGAARQFVMPDSIPVDTLLLEEPEELF